MIITYYMRLNFTPAQCVHLLCFTVISLLCSLFHHVTERGEKALHFSST